MPEGSIPVNRTLVGVLAIGCTLTGLAFAIFDSFESAAFGAFLRTGVLLGAFWLALPSKNRDAAWANVSPWTLAITVVLILILVRRPRAFLPLIAVVAAAAIFIRPRRRP